MNQDASPYRIQAVHDAFRVLEALVKASEPMTAMEVAAETGISRNRSFRLMKTMEESGYIRSAAGSSAHRPTLKIFSLGQRVSSKLSIEDLARPILDRLRKELNETVYLTTRQGDDVVCLMTIESMRTFRITARPGSRWPIGRGAAGAALLLGSSEAYRSDYLDRQPQLRERWPAITEHFQREGVTYVDGRDGRTTDEDVIAMGIPLRDSEGESNFAICVTWPVSRVEIDLASLKESLRSSAEEIELELGYRYVPALVSSDIENAASEDRLIRSSDSPL